MLAGHPELLVRTTEEDDMAEGGETGIGTSRCTTAAPLLIHALCGMARGGVSWLYLLPLPEGFLGEPVLLAPCISLGHGV